MPTRLGVAAVIAFWLATTAVVVRRDIWPRYFGGDPPAVAIDIADEATQLAATNWVITRSDEPVGSLRAHMVYVPEDDTFRFVNNYARLRLEVADGVTLVVPHLTTEVRVSRDGALREQSMRGEMAIQLRGVELGSAKADVDGVVEGGFLKSHCTIEVPPGAKVPAVDRDLDPVPAPGGQVLNPLMPVNRLRGITPGRRWVVRAVDPLADAAVLLVRELGKDSALVRAIPAPESRELLAEVGDEPQLIEREVGEPTPCWVIRYRHGGEGEARTWVSVRDGRVLRQEAVLSGDSIRFDRVE